MVLRPRVCAIALVIGLNIPGGLVARGPIQRRAARYERPPAALVTERACMREPAYRVFALVGAAHASGGAVQSTAAASFAEMHAPEACEAVAGARTSPLRQNRGVPRPGNFAGALPARGPPA